MEKDDLTKRIEMWRTLQEVHMPLIIEVTRPKGTAKKAAKAMEVVVAEVGKERAEVAMEVTEKVTEEKKAETEVANVDGDAAEIAAEQLCLPSEFDELDRIRLNLVNLAEEEGKLREGHAFSCILQLQRLMKTTSALQLLRKKNMRGQRQNTRAHTQHNALDLTCDRLLEVYNTTQKALTSIYPNDTHISEQFPPLTKEDLQRKSTVDKRQLGDTYRTDGRLWRLGSSTRRTTATALTSSDPSASPSQSASPSVPSSQDVQNSGISGSGRLWDPRIGLTTEEMEEWELEG